MWGFFIEQLCQGLPNPTTYLPTYLPSPCSPTALRPKEVRRNSRVGPVEPGGRGQGGICPSLPLLSNFDQFREKTCSKKRPSINTCPPPLLIFRSSIVSGEIWVPQFYPPWPPSLWGLKEWSILSTYPSLCCCCCHFFISWQKSSRSGNLIEPRSCALYF